MVWGNANMLSNFCAAAHVKVILHFTVGWTAADRTPIRSDRSASRDFAGLASLRPSRKAARDTLRARDWLR